jgi:hypothetical protein
MVRKTFTQEETEQIATLYREGKWVTEIAKQLGTCSYIVARALKAAGFLVVKRVEVRLLTDEEKAMVEEMYPNYSLDFIASQLHIGREIVTKHLRAAGTTISGRGKKRVYPTVDGKKICCQCKAEKSVNEFSRHSTTYDGLQPACKECQNRRGSSEKVFKKFGVDREAMEQEQNNLCAICGEPETRMKFGKPTRLAVDHNHKTGQVRELICSSCNLVLGKIKENPDTCDKIKAYILKHTIGGNQK